MLYQWLIGSYLSFIFVTNIFNASCFGPLQMLNQNAMSHTFVKMMSVCVNYAQWLSTTTTTIVFLKNIIKLILRT